MPELEDEIHSKPRAGLPEPENDTPTRKRGKRPHLFLYSLLVPILWFSAGSLLQSFAPTVQLGGSGLFLIVFVAVWITCWHFTKQFGRHFLRAERIWLIIFTTIWAELAESLALWALLDDRSLAGAQPLSTYAVCGILAFTLVFDAFVMWTSYTFLAKRIITRLLGQDVPASS